MKRNSLYAAVLCAASCLAGQVREYNLTLQLSWKALDGNPRSVLTVNGQSPGPVIEADEGDTLRVHVENKLLIEATMHWHGVYQLDKYWNDGVPGVTQYPIEPRNSYTYEMTVGNQTGIYFYHGHFGPAFADGQRGPLWIRPAAWRPRPYSLISDDADDVKAMLAAEYHPRHALVSEWNYEGMEILMVMYRDTGVTPSCGASIIFNDKGRTICQPRDVLVKYDRGDLRDSMGCLPPLVNGLFNHEKDQFVNERECVSTEHDLEVFEAKEGERYMFINFVHPGAHHELRISIDEHDMWIVAADGDFTFPKKVQAINLNMGDRISVIVKLDQKPRDYAIRASSVVAEQIIQGFSILRYAGVGEVREAGVMPIPDSKPHIDLVGNMISDGKMMDEMKDLSPFPARPPPIQSDKTFRFVVNRTDASTWVLTSAAHQGFRQQLPPILWNKDSMGPTSFGGIPNGTTVDLIYENAATGDHPFHKHNHKTWIIGQGEGFFRWPDVATAIKEVPENFNMIDPPFRDGARLRKEYGAWTVVRYTITFPALSMLHCHKIAHFAAGQQIILIEGAEAMKPFPEEIKSLTHADFVPPLRYGPLD